MSELPAVINQALVDLNVVLPRLIKGQDIGVGILKDITKVTKDTRQSVIDKLAENDKCTDKINALRAPITKRLDELKQSIMVYEKTSRAEYDRVKKLVSDFDQIELEITRKAESKAKHELEITTYKATLKDAVGKQVVSMVGGQVRNIIEGMSKWQASLTLENIDKKAEELKARQLQLKREAYDNCFQLEFIGKRTDLLTDEELAAFQDTLKKEYSYEKANEDYLQQASPLINEYRAKLPDIKIELAKSLGNVNAEVARKKAIEEKAWADLTANTKATDEKMEEVKNDKDKSIMNAEFVRQGTLAGMEAPSVKRVPEFEDINLNKWVKPFLEIVAKCAVHPKFKLVKQKKAEYIDAIQWWMDWYGANFDEPIPGIVLKEVAKTVVRASKAEDI